MKKVLIIDDDCDILEAIGVIVETEGYEAVSFDHLIDLKKVVKIKPDLIIVDLLLKGESGANFCIDVKNNLATAKIPVIILSAHARCEVDDVLKKSAADDFMLKPFNMHTFVKVINKFL